MIYVSEKTLRIIKEILEHFRRNPSTPGRVLKADVIHVALEEYARKLGLKVD